MMKRPLLALAAAAALSIAWLGFHDDDKPAQPAFKRPPAIPDEALNPKALARVGESYTLTVAPLMKRACFDCHSSQTDFPWYHKLPGVAQYLDSHVEEGRRRLDLTDGFPFKGRAPIISRVRGIGREVDRGDMPLWDYKLMHPASRFTPEEKKIVVDWASASFDYLSKTAKKI